MTTPPGVPRKVWEDDGKCYVCGKDNPEGMHLEIRLEGREIVTQFVAASRHQGYKGVLHGGILAMLLDEVVVWLPYKLFGAPVVTAELKTRLIRPVPVGSEVVVRAFFEEKGEAGQRIYRVGAECSVGGVVMARGSAKCVRVG